MQDITTNNTASAIVAPKDHHEFPPSALNRFASCPASYKVCLGWASPQSAASERGTLLHRAVYDDETYLSLPEADRAAINFIRENHLKPYPEEQGYIHLHEHRMILKDENGEEINFGTCDILLLDPTKTVAMVKDWKFGNIPVPPAFRNFQLIDYALSAMQEFTTVKTVFVEVVQPALEMGSEGAEENPDKANDKVAEFHREDEEVLLEAIRLVIRRCREANLDNPADYSCTPENCRFCNRLGCMAHRQKMEQNFSLFMVDGEQALAFAQTDEGRMTVDYANSVLLAKKAIENVMEAKAASAQAVILAAGGSSDFKVVDGRTRRNVDWKRLAEDLRIPQETIDAYTTTTVSKPFLNPVARRAKLPPAVAAKLPPKRG